MYHKIKLFNCILIFLCVTACAQKKDELTLDKLTFTENESTFKNKELSYEFNSKTDTTSENSIFFKKYHSVKFFTTTDEKLLIYEGVKGNKLEFCTFDGIIGEYTFTGSGKENVEKMIAKIFKKYPNLRSYRNDPTNRFKAKINDSTYVQVYFHDDYSEVISFELQYTTKYKNGSSIWLYDNADELGYRKEYEENVKIEYYPDKEWKYKVVLEPK